MRDESQNALLKTLEEPPGFAHLILLSSEPEALLETISSRCQPVEFAALPTAAIEMALEGDPALDADRDEIAAAARTLGRRPRARPLPALRRGAPPRTSAVALAGAVGRGSADTQPARASADPAPRLHGAHC